MLSSGGFFIRQDFFTLNPVILTNISLASEKVGPKPCRSISKMWELLQIAIVQTNSKIVGTQLLEKSFQFSETELTTFEFIDSFFKILRQVSRDYNNQCSKL